MVQASLPERIRTLLRASDGALPVAIETLLNDLAEEVQLNTDELANLKLAYLGHLTECPHIEAPAPRPMQMSERLAVVK